MSMLRKELDSMPKALRILSGDITAPDHIPAMCLKDAAALIESLDAKMLEAWKLVNAMAGQEYWDRAEQWLRENKDFAPECSAGGGL